MPPASGGRGSVQSALRAGKQTGDQPGDRPSLVEQIQEATDAGPLGPLSRPIRSDRFPRPIPAAGSPISGAGRGAPILQLSPRLEFEQGARVVAGLAGTGATVTVADQVRDQIARGTPADEAVRNTLRGVFASIGSKPTVNTGPITNTGEFIGLDPNPLVDFAGEEVRDFAIKKGIKLGLESVLENIFGLAAGIKKAPGVEIGGNILTGTAGGGEEAAIALLNERNAAIAALQQGFNIARHVQFGGRGIAGQIVQRDP